MAKRRSRGEGSIFYRSSKGLWVAKITLPDGKSKTKYSRDQKTVREWLVVQRNALRQGLFSKDDAITVSAFLTNYMETVGQHTLRPKTVEAYSYLIRSHIIPVLGRIKLSQLRPDQVQSLYSQKLEAGLSRRTVQFIHSIIHKSLEQALRWGLVVRNVSDLVDPPSPTKRPPTIYTVEQINKLLEAVSDSKIKLALNLAVSGGFREGEILGIHLEDIEVETGTIKVSHAVQYQVGKGVVITTPKTDKSRRSVRLPAQAASDLREYASQLNRDQGLLFTTSSAKPINPRFLIKKFKEAIEVAGLPEIRFHDLRHTHSTLLLQAGVNPRLVQDRLGHSSITLTMDTYSHVLPGMQDEVVEKLDKVFGTP
jgi:integrase